MSEWFPGDGPIPQHLAYTSGFGRDELASTNDVNDIRDDHNQVNWITKSTEREQISRRGWTTHSREK
jgi:hypothetical protein